MNRHRENRIIKADSYVLCIMQTITTIIILLLYPNLKFDQALSTVKTRKGSTRHKSTIFKTRRYCFVITLNHVTLYPNFKVKQVRRQLNKHTRE